MPAYPCSFLTLLKFRLTGQLHAQFTEGENIHIVNKGKYDERVNYHSYDPHPLLVEMYSQIERYDDIQTICPALYG